MLQERLRHIKPLVKVEFTSSIRVGSFLLVLLTLEISCLLYRVSLATQWVVHGLNNISILGTY